MEAVARHVHPIAFLLQIVHQFVGTIHHPRLRGTEIKELIAHLQTEFFGDIKAFANTQRTTETLHNEERTVDLSLRVTRPQVDVSCPVCIIERLRGIEITIKAESLKCFLQGNNGIAVGVVERIVEVDKKIFIH